MKCTGLVDETINVGIGGEAGQGIGRSGMLLGKALMRAGFYVCGNIDYPSLIRGGHNYYMVRTSHRKVYSVVEKPDLVVALNKETILLHQNQVNPGGGIIYDQKEKISKDELTRKDIEYYPVPFTGIVEELGGPNIMRNTVALGAVSSLVGLEMDYLKEIVMETFEGRAQIIKMNNNAIQRGWEYVIEFNNRFQCSMEPGERPQRMWLTGNEAVALGALAAGCKFYAAYPMTPASPILHYFTGHDEETDSVAVQTENEIAAMCMTVGASFTGVRVMTSTSGGGFCLMTEALSLAAMTESPVVVMLGQRPGPSTGLATYSAQGDLLFAVYGAHGEFQRIVLAPGDIEECFYMSGEAFNLADRYQIPVILLTDKNIIESHETVTKFDANRIRIDRGKQVTEWSNEEEYLRYKFTYDGVSPRAVIGIKNAITHANGNEHTEKGFTTSKAQSTIEMVNKRFRKTPYIKQATEKLEPIKVYGSSKPDITIVGWGSTKGPVMEALRILEETEIGAIYVQVRVMEPFPEGLDRYFRGKTMLFENNRSAELGTLIKLNTGYEFEHIELRYDGRPFEPNEIVAKVKGVLE
ncbi:2-oxoacid:acceptor oxidoreductase subunit alpha [Thermoproteota archaeon]